MHIFIVYFSLSYNNTNLKNTRIWFSQHQLPIEYGQETTELRLFEKNPDTTKYIV